MMNLKVELKGDMMTVTREEEDESKEGSLLNPNEPIVMKYPDGSISYFHPDDEYEEWRCSNPHCSTNGGKPQLLLRSIGIDWNRGSIEIRCPRCKTLNKR